MKRFLSTIIMTLALSGAAKAIDIETLVLKNGSEYHGYIQKQDGNGHISFMSDNATITLNGKDIKAYTNEKRYKINELDSAWIKWAEANDAFEGFGDKRTLTLFDLATKDKTIPNVYLCERGTNVMYHEIVPTNYTFSWEDIKCIKRAKRSKLDLSGIDITYQLKSGIEYTGQYAAESDSTLSLFLGNGIMQTMNVYDVIKYTYSAINSDQTIFEQSPLLDVIKTKDGELIKGIIIEKNYTTGKESDDHFIVASENESPRTVKISDISETLREANPSYSPKTDIALEKGEIRINRKKTTIVSAKMTDGEFRFEKVDGTAINKGSSNSTSIIVEYLNKTGGNAEQFQIVKLKTATVKNKTTFCFNYEDIVNSAYHASNITTSANNTTAAEYAINGTGNYALFDSKAKNVIFINIK